MKAFDSFSQSFNNHFSYQQNTIKQEQYLPMMDSFPDYNHMAWNNAYFTGSDQDFKLDMMRSMSGNAMNNTHSDVAPSLHSTTSLPSASSSTVGSPYSGHAQLVSNTTIQYGGNPTIVYDTDFPHAYETAHFDHESFFQEPKMAGISVGKSESLSALSQTSSIMPVSEFPTAMNFVPAQANNLVEPYSQPLVQAQMEIEQPKVTSVPAPSNAYSRGDAVFKSPTIPASAYPRISSILPSPTMRTIAAEQLSQSPESRDYSLCNSELPLPSILPSANYAQNQFFSQSSGNFLPPIEAFCSSFLLFFSHFPVPISFLIFSPARLQKLLFQTFELTNFLQIQVFLPAPKICTTTLSDTNNRRSNIRPLHHQFPLATVMHHSANPSQSITSALITPR